MSGSASPAQANGQSALPSANGPAFSRSASFAGHHILIVQADCGQFPATLRNNLLALDPTGTVDNFDATTGTPNVATLLAYDTVVAYSDCGYLDATTLGNNLVTFMDAGGVVVAFNFDWYGGTQSIQGTWLSGGYSPFNNPGTVNFTSGTLGTYTVGHPLMAGISSLNSLYREILTLASGATQVAAWNDGTPLIAYKGHAVGVSGYVGDSSDNWSGDFARVILNAANWLGPACPGAIQNGGFELGSFSPGWIISATNPTPIITTTQAHTGAYDAHVGSLPGGETPGDSAFYQPVTVPPGGGSLSYWYWPRTVDSISFDWQDAYVTNLSGTVLATIMHVAQNTQTWTHVTYNMAAFAGQTVAIKFLVHGDNAGDPTDMFVDDVSLIVPGAAPGGVVMSGPQNGIVNNMYVFTGTVAPLSVTLPLTYTWQATEQTPVTHNACSATDAAGFIWGTGGTKLITLTVANDAGSASGTYSVTMQVPPLSLTVSGADSVLAGATSTFTATVAPLTANTPITYVWRVTGQLPVTHTLGDPTDTASFTWNISGTQLITVTAANAAGVVTATHPLTTLIVLPTSLSLTGPASGIVNSSELFTATVGPITATQPLTYAWQATGQAPLTHVLTSASDSVNFNWNAVGAQAISVTVTNAGGSASTNHIIMINNPAPVLTGLNPLSATARGPTFTLTLTGTGFVDASLVRWNGLDRATTFVSGTQVHGTITAADLATGGVASVTVFNPLPGGGESNAIPFTVTGALQSITFAPLPDMMIGSPPFAITATASSGLAVTFTASGSCSVSGTIVTLSAAGSCTVTAHQAGDATYDAAPDVPRTFAITNAMLYLPLIER